MEKLSSDYKVIKAEELNENVVKLIGKGWMLVTAGDSKEYNTMTASWGGLGFLFNRPVTFTFIRKIRHTFSFLTKKERFTLSFFDEQYRDALTFCGRNSGRDCDKAKECGLTAVETENGNITFKEAKLVIECEKIMIQPLELESFVELYKDQIIGEAYTKEDEKHQMFISKIVNIYSK